MIRPFQKLISAEFETTLKFGKTVKVCVENENIGTCKDIIADFMVRNFYSSEELAVAAGMNKSEKALQEMHGFLLNNLPKLSVVAYYDPSKNDTMPIAVSLMQLVSRDSPDIFNPEIFSEMENKKQFTMSRDIEAEFDVLKEFGVDSYYSDIGIAVDPEYQKLGIVTHMCLVRKWVCEQNGVPINSSLMTSLATQIAGERTGHVTSYEIPSEVLAKRHNVHFKNAPPMFKFMVQEGKSGNSKKHCYFKNMDS